MVGVPAPRLVGDPGPPIGRDPGPSSVIVGGPPLRNTWPPHVSIFGGVHPLPVIAQFVGRSRRNAGLLFCVCKRSRLLKGVHVSPLEFPDTNLFPDGSLLTRLDGELPLLNRNGCLALAYDKRRIAAFRGSHPIFPGHGEYRPPFPGGRNADRDEIGFRQVETDLSGPEPEIGFPVLGAKEGKLGAARQEDELPPVELQLRF